VAAKAFECSALTNDLRKQEAILQIGLKTGREFLEFKSSRPEDYKKIEDKIPLIWIGRTRADTHTTPDFVHGHVYTMILFSLTKTIGDADTETMQDRLYNERGCILLDR
jgi:hypothetical protein